MEDKRNVNKTRKTSYHERIAVLTADINKLNGHFKQHPKDKHSNRGLLKKIGRRRDLLKYLKNKDIERYASLVQRLGLRR